jgi:hypothetical protein
MFLSDLSDLSVLRLVLVFWAHMRLEVDRTDSVGVKGSRFDGLQTALSTPSQRDIVTSASELALVFIIEW